jgi:hypothetical protein
VSRFSRAPRDRGSQADDNAGASSDPLSALPAEHPAPSRGDASRHELSVRTARKDGREVVSLRCVERDGSYAVECDVYPLGALQIDPLSRGPYNFETLADANLYLDEAVRALGILGCDVL